MITAAIFMAAYRCQAHQYADNFRVHIKMDEFESKTAKPRRNCQGWDHGATRVARRNLEKFK
jgi:hypothetical protein